MHSHLHLICRATEGFRLTDILRDFKKFTSKKIVRQIEVEPESRKEWLLPLLKKYCEHLKREQNYKLWQDGNHAKVIYSKEFFWVMVFFWGNEFFMYIYLSIKTEETAHL